MHGIVDGFSRKGQLVAATDAGYKPRAGAGIAYIVSDGRFGLRRWVSDRWLDPTGPSAVLVAELRAVAYLMEHLRLPPSSLLLIDSKVALGYLQTWQRGDAEHMPAGYSLRPRLGNLGTPTLVRLASILAASPSLKVEHVHGHMGHSLNEAADGLASLALRKVPAEEVRTRAKSLAGAFLTAWYAEADTAEREDATGKPASIPYFAPRSSS
jgi:ribonuclease HI